MLAIVDYGIGNLTSIKNMLKKSGHMSVISKSVEEISFAKKIILPGMGNFDQCMKQFNGSGLREVIEQKVFNDKTPVLGICVGLQMMMRSSEEGTEEGLNWINGHTIRFNSEKMAKSLKIPNMGWLEVSGKKDSALLHLLNDARFYFAHSYHVVIDEKQDEFLSAHYGYEVVVGVEKDNIFGVQFHPEKSHRFGLQLLKNFAEL